jgi:hypothetical protein
LRARDVRVDLEDHKEPGRADMRRRHLIARGGRTSRFLTALLAAAALAAALAATAAAHDAEHLSGYGTPPPPGGGLTPLATHLNQPKKLSIAPDGSVLVAESGDGAGTQNCTSGEEPECFDESGAIARITQWGKVTTLLGKLPSVSSGGIATGPAQARYEHGALEVLFQDTAIDPKTGESPFGPGATFLGDLVRFPYGATPKIQARFGPFEAQNNPDKGEGSGVELELGEHAIDSDPYAFVPYHGGWAVADAAANDLLWVSPWGDIHVLAVFPTINEIAPPGTLGPEQKAPVPVKSQPVPDSVAIGPDGALYVGELGGFPFEPGSSKVWRVVPGHAPTVFASGFTAIGDVKFDPTGRLLVLEIDQAGLNDAFEAKGLPTPGAVIGVHRNGSKSTLLSTGLEFPTGLAVDGGHIYVSNFGVLPATGGPEGLSGEVDRVTLPSWWWSHPW